VRHDHRPTETLPARASFAEHTPETVLEYVVEPVGGVVLQLALAARRLQHGRVQAYVLYLLVGLAALAVVVLVGGDK
jgi:hydrogenase-4 component B